MDFKQRIEVELKELKERISSLGGFLDSDSKAVEVAGKEQVELMWKQLNHMHEYRDILQERLDLLNAS